MKAILCGLHSAVLALLFAIPAAASSYDAGVRAWIQATGSCYTPIPVSGPTEASASMALPVWGTGGGSGTAAADASVSGLHASVAGGVTGSNGQASTQLGGCTLARQTLDDVVVSGPAGNVSIQYSVHIVGTLDETATGSTSSLHSFTVWLDVHGGNGEGDISSSGDVDFLFTSDPSTVTVGQPFLISIELQTSCYVFAAGGGGSSIGFDSDYETAFPTGIPVFTLPPGYTVNSAAGGIVDNLFTGGPVGVAFDSSPDETLHVLPASPNPMSNGTTLRFRLPRPGSVDLAIYDVTGRRVRRLAHGHRLAGDHAEVWDGTDDLHRAVAPGVYLYRLDTSEGARTGKVVKRTRAVR